MIYPKPGDIIEHRSTKDLYEVLEDNIIKLIKKGNGMKVNIANIGKEYHYTFDQGIMKSWAIMEKKFKACNKPVWF
jgi:hypothetical protein